MSDIGGLGKVSTVGSAPDVVSAQQPQAAAEPQTIASASDSVGRDAVGAFALAFARFGALQESGEGNLVQSYGVRLTELLAALPVGMRTEFLAQLAAARSLPTNADGPSKRETAFTEAELARAIRASIAETVDAATSLSAARLARYVARDEIDSAMQTLSGPASGEATGTSQQQLAAYGFSPQRPSIDSREKRRHDDRQRRPQPTQHAAEHDAVEPSENACYTLDDIVQFAGVTIAERRTLPADVGDTDR